MKKQIDSQTQTKTYQRVLKDIKKHIKRNSDFFVNNKENWYIGITNDVDSRAREHHKKLGSLFYFKSYYCYSFGIASKIEDKISASGTANAIGSRGANNTSKHVYVFKAIPSILDEIKSLLN